ncbi:MAG: transcription antitermination protein NusB [Planctomycetes bacterium]|nr:transcription antitermination protein NusB [Planctomycetota bacterium]
MTDSSSNQPLATLTQEGLRLMAFEHYLMLGEPGAATASTDPLESLPPNQRERVAQMAIRRLTFQVLFELDAVPAADALQIRGILARVPGLGPLEAERVSDTVTKAMEWRKDADTLVRELAPNWPTHRQPAVDRAILRLVYAELKLGKTDAPLIINEAVELAKRFSTEHSPAFINGVADNMRKRLTTAIPPAPTPGVA